jgi:hypothetical protein
MKLLIGVISLGLAIAVSGATVENGNFEKSQDGPPADWKILGSGVSVEPFVSAGWNHAERIFNGGNYKTIRVCLGIQGSAGTVWFDNVHLGQSSFSPLKVANFSFEEGAGTTLSGWGQDDAGVRTFRDTNLWTRFPGQGFGSGASARVSSADGKTARIWQDIPIAGRGETHVDYSLPIAGNLGEPNTDYVISFDWRAKGPSSEVCFKAYGAKEDGQPGRELSNKTIASQFPPEQFGRNVARLSLVTPGETGLSQRVALSSADWKRPLRVNAQVRVEQLSSGSVTLSVESGSQSHSVAEITRADGLWQELSVNFVPGATDPQITIRVKATDGNHGPPALVYVDNITIGPAAIIPEPKHLKWLSLDKSFSIPENLKVEVKGKSGAVVASALRLFSESLKKQTGIITEPTTQLGADEAGVELTVASDKRTRREPESYSLQVSPKRVKIVSADERGALYGLMTLLELVQPAPGGGSIILAASIDDHPDFHFRGVHLFGSYDRAYLDHLARLRFNSVVIPSNYGNDPEKRRKLEEAFADCRALGIEAIPEVQSLGWETAILVDPNVVEGTEVVGEKLTLVGDQPLALAHPNIIRTESTNIRIIDTTGARIFEEGRDYEVLPGDMKFARADVHDGFSSQAAPFRVRRTSGSQIPEGVPVLASYDYAAHVDLGNCPYCPNEPRVYQIMGTAISNIIHDLHPKYLHIGHDEVLQMGTDSRCRKSGRSNAENFAKDVVTLYQIAKAQDPNIRVMMWGDMLDPYSHGFLANSSYPENGKPRQRDSIQMAKDSTVPAADLLPKDIIMDVWYFDPSDPPAAGLKALEFFGRKGFSTTCGPYADPVCARRWSVAAKHVRDAGMDCIGILNTPWGGEHWQSIEESAHTSWRVPRER